MTASRRTRNSGHLNRSFNPATGSARPLSWIAVAVISGTVIGTMAGCMGGSGSSGFDIAEGLAIQRVVDQGDCEVFDGLTICPADTSDGSAASPSATATASPGLTESPLPTTTAPVTDITMPPTIGTPPGPASTATPTASPPPTSDPFTTATAASTGSPTRAASTPTATIVPSSTAAATATHSQTRTVPATATAKAPATNTPTPTTVPRMEILTNRTSFADRESVCVPGSEPGICIVDFEFVALGFAAEAAFRVAARPLGGEAPWIVSVPIANGLVSSGPTYVAPIPVNLSPASSANVETLQIVVLGFESDPGPVPERVDRLSETGADLAFAVEPLPILTD